MIELLKVENLADYELDILEELQKEKEILRDELDEEFEEKLQKEAEKVAERKIQKAVQEKEQEKEKQKKQIIQKFIQEKKIAITKMLKANLKLEAIAEFSNLSMPELEQYIKEIRAAK